MSSVKIVDVIIRKTAEKTVLTGEGNLSVSVSAPSVIEVHGSAQDVARYVRQGKDLLLYMKDGSVIRCTIISWKILKVKTIQSWSSTMRINLPIYRLLRPEKRLGLRLLN